MNLNFEYLIAISFSVEVLVEATKNFLELEKRHTLIFAIIYGFLLSMLTLPETIKYQLGWSADIPDFVSAIITGLIASSFAKFYDYLYKFIKFKDN